MSNFWNFLEDPGGYVSGQNKEGFHGMGQFLRGDPDNQKAAYQKAMDQAHDNGIQTRDYLMGREANAENYYAPLKKMFASAYGNGVMNSPQSPSVPGSSPLTSMYGGR